MRRSGTHTFLPLFHCKVNLFPSIIYYASHHPSKSLCLCSVNHAVVINAVLINTTNFMNSSVLTILLVKINKDLLRVWYAHECNSVNSRLK